MTIRHDEWEMYNYIKKHASPLLYRGQYTLVRSGKQ